MNVVLWFPRTFLTLVLWQSLFAYCCDEESAESPYVVDQEWKQLLDVDPPIDDELRGAKLLKLLEHQLGAKAPAWWQPLVKSVGTGHRSAHMIENDNAVESLSKRWNTEGNAPFTGFTAVMGSVNEKRLELRDGPKTFLLTSQIDWRDTQDQILNRTNGLSGRLVGNECFLVPECPVESPGGPRTLYCFDTYSGKLKWKADLVDGMIGAYNHLQFGSYTEIVVDKGKVIVWTGSEIAASVQAFKITGGEPLLRFSTNGDRL